MKMSMSKNEQVVCSQIPADAFELADADLAQIQGGGGGGFGDWWSHHEEWEHHHYHHHHCHHHWFHDDREHR